MRIGRPVLPFATVLLSLAAGCAHRPAPPHLPPGDDTFATALDAVSRKSLSTHSFRCAGTMLAEYGTERHFIHFTALFSRTGGIRFDLEEGGPLGIGSGRLTWIERGDSLEVLLPGEEAPIVRPSSSGFDDIVDTRGLLSTDASYLVAPYAGDPRLYETGHLAAAAVEKRTGNLRLVLKRPDSLREVILVEPNTLSLVERRVVRPDGTVLLKATYRYGDTRGALSAEEVDGAILPDVPTIRIRFREKEWNGDLNDTLFSSLKRPR